MQLFVSSLGGLFDNLAAGSQLWAIQVYITQVYSTALLDVKGIPFPEHPTGSTMNLLTEASLLTQIGFCYVVLVTKKLITVMPQYNAPRYNADRL